MLRVARRRVVIVTFDPEVSAQVWIVRDYLPEHRTVGLSTMPSLAILARMLPDPIVRPVLVRNDCTDRMCATLRERPEQYLDPTVRAATSTGHHLPTAVARGRSEPFETILHRVRGTSATGTSASPPSSSRASRDRPGETRRVRAILGNVLDSPADRRVAGVKLFGSSEHQPCRWRTKSGCFPSDRTGSMSVTECRDIRSPISSLDRGVNVPRAISLRESRFPA